MKINDDKNKGKLCEILTKFIRKLTHFFFRIIGEKSSTNLPLNNMYYLRKMGKLTCLYVPMNLTLDYYPPHYDKQYDIFEETINKEFRCIHGYKNHDEHNVLITWASIKSLEMLLSKFP